MKPPVFKHRFSLVESRAVGPGTRVWAWAHVMKGARVGSDCNIGEHCFIETGAVLGNRVTVKNGVAIWEGVTLEDDVFLGPNAVLTNDLLPRSKVYHARVVPTLVMRGASVGANATILCGTRIGRWSLIGAGSVVTKDVPAHALVVGNPARVVGFVCRCAGRLRKRGRRGTCVVCRRKYRFSTRTVRQDPGTDTDDD